MSDQYNGTRPPVEEAVSPPYVSGAPYQAAPMPSFRAAPGGRTQVAPPGSAPAAPLYAAPRVATVSLDVDFCDLPAVLTAGPLGTLMYVCCMCYCQRFGVAVIPAEALATLADWQRAGVTASETAEGLIAAGLLTRERFGFRLVSYRER